MRALWLESKRSTTKIAAAVAVRDDVRDHRAAAPRAPTGCSSVIRQELGIERQVTRLRPASRSSTRAAARARRRGSARSSRPAREQYPAASVPDACQAHGEPAGAAIRDRTWSRSPSREAAASRRPRACTSASAPRCRSTGSASRSRRWRSRATGRRWRAAPCATTSTIASQAAQQVLGESRERDRPRRSRNGLGHAARRPSTPARRLGDMRSRRRDGLRYAVGRAAGRASHGQRGIRRARRYPANGRRKLVLVRHGQSTWNLENLFTGWVDVDLTDRAARSACRGPAAQGRRHRVRLAFTSVLKRAIRTLWIVLDEMDLMWLPVERSWRLNERHYGALQGLDKAQTVEKHGADQVKIWRRSYDIPPPPLRSTTRVIRASIAATPLAARRAARDRIAQGHARARAAVLERRASRPSCRPAATCSSSRTATACAPW